MIHALNARALAVTTILPAVFAAWIMSSHAIAQVAPATTPWGEPVEGVQLRLALAASQPPPPPGAGGMPTLEVQIRNQGSASIRVAPEKLMFADIEIDDVWHVQTYASAGIAPTVVLAPGPQSVHAVRTGHNVFQLFAANTTAVHSFEYRPGPHRIRVRTEVTTADGKRIKIVSNRITIDIPDSFLYGAAVDRLALGIWNEKPAYRLDERNVCPLTA